MSNQPLTPHTLAIHLYRRHRSALTTILTAILTLVVSGTVQAQQTGRLVEAVEVIGYRRLAKEDILKNVKTRPGEPYSSKRIQRDLQSLLALGWFNKTGTRVFKENGLRGGVIVVFEVHEMPLILDVAFEGLRDIRESELIETFRQEDIKVAKGSTYNPVHIRKAMRTIRKFFASRGWPETAITVQQEIGGTCVSVTFIVER